MDNVYPNDSKEYREARDALLQEEHELVDKVKSVAAKRRKLPLGGEIKEDYIFKWATTDKLGKDVKLSELFQDKDTLLFYSMMYGPNWGDTACESCTSLIDGFDRIWRSVTLSGAAFAVVAKAPAERINNWAKRRGWTQIPLVSGAEVSYQADYHCQEKSDDDMQWPMMHVFVKRGGKIYRFWSSGMPPNHVDTIWPYWNLMDMTPQGRPDRDTPPQDYICEFPEGRS